MEFLNKYVKKMVMERNFLSNNIIGVELFNINLKNQ